MAIYNEILVGRYNRALQKLLGIKGSPPVRQVGGEIMPIFTVFYGAENRFLEAWYRYGFAFDQPAVGGLTTAVRVRNPTASGILTVLESIKLWSAGAQNLQIRQRANSVVDADLGTGTNIFSMEQRTKPTPISNQQFASTHLSTDLAGNQQGTLMYMIPMPAGGNVVELINDENQEIVIDPGQWLNFFGDLANTRWVMSLTWRERQIEESETK